MLLRIIIIVVKIKQNNCQGTVIPNIINIFNGMSDSVRGMCVLRVIALPSIVVLLLYAVYSSRFCELCALCSVCSIVNMCTAYLAHGAASAAAAAADFVCAIIALILFVAHASTLPGTPAPRSII